MAESKYSEIPQEAAPDEVGSNRPTVSWRNLLDNGRALWLLAAVASVVVTTLVASVQPLRPNALVEPPTFSADWWYYPQETNAFKRLPVIPENLNDVALLADGDSLVAVGDNGLIVRSEDGGLSWAKATINVGNNTQSSLSNNANNGFMAAYAADGVEEKAPAPPAFGISLEKSSTQLNSIEQQPQTFKQEQEVKQQTEEPALPQLLPEQLAQISNFKSVYFVDDKLGWLVGDNGTVLKTSDGGRSWKIQSSRVPDTLSSVQFLDSQHGFAVGNNGTILETIDGGDRWQLISRGSTRLLVSYITANLYSVHFINAQSGWVVGSDGAIFSTSDGGRSWREQSSGTSNVLYSVRFVSPRHGWVVGSEGTIISTQDGGVSWEAQASGTRELLLSVQFLDRLRGWAVGSAGTMVGTRDGGASWQVQPNGTNIRLSSIVFHDSLRGWAVGSNGTVLHTIDGGVNWLSQTGGTASSFYAVQFVDPQRGWAVGSNGRISLSTNGGASWRPQSSGVSADLFSLQFLNPQRGWAVGDNGTILHTTNGGVYWESQSSGTPSSLFSLQFLDSQLGWATGDNGTILHTDNGGANWQVQSSGAVGRISTIQFLDPQQGWAAEVTGYPLKTTDGGASWQAQTLDSEIILSSVQFFNPQQGLAIGVRGIVRHTTDGGTNWNPPTSPAGTGFPAVQFLNPQTGWVAGVFGDVLHTTNGGKSWQSQPNNTRSSLYSVQFLDSQHGWIAGDSGTVLRTTDGGASWSDIEASRHPAPWYYASWLLTLILLLPALSPKSRNAQSEAVQTVSIANQVSSDRPLTRDDPDPLGFGRIAASVSRFLRHEKTTGPLTLAISGRWGSGKSSLMNLVSSDLQRHGFVPVWFNAWHNQNEENLLDALVTAIRQQGRQRFFTSRPPFINPYWFSFLFRRLYRWSAEHYLQTLILVCAATVAITLYSANINLLKVHTIEACQYLFDSCNSDEATAAVEQSESEGLDKEWFIWVLGTLVTAAGGPIALFKSLRTLPRIRRSRGPEFRGEYARYFRNFNDNLKPMSLVVFIDDLDRCDTNTVMRTLEATNYLVSSGDCFVILGMDYNIVRNSVAVGYQSLAAQMEKDHSAAGQAAFANEYLEKLINIQLEVPDMESAEMLKLALPENLGKDLDYYERLSRWVHQKWARYWRMILIALVVIGGFQLGNHLLGLSGTVEPIDTLEQAVVEPTVNTGATAANSRPTGNNNEPRQTAVDTKAAGDVISPVVIDNSGDYLLVPIVLIALVAVWVVVRGRDDIQYDSNTFKDALEIWLPLAAQRRETPRAVKRFVNRTRYFAMRLRDERMAAEADADKESTIVALSAIHQIDPDFIARPGNDAISIVSYFSNEATLKHLGLSDEVTRQVIQLVARANTQHEQTFATELTTEIQHTLPLFREISKGIEVK